MNFSLGRLTSEFTQPRNASPQKLVNDPLVESRRNHCNPRRF
jgi:hypothetical protein